MKIYLYLGGGLLDTSGALHIYTYITWDTYYPSLQSWSAQSEVCTRRRCSFFGHKTITDCAMMCVLYTTQLASSWRLSEAKAGIDQSRVPDCFGSLQSDFEVPRSVA